MELHLLQGCKEFVRSLTCFIVFHQMLYRNFFLDLMFPSESSLHFSWSCGSDYSSTHDNEYYQSLVTNSSIRDRAHLLAASDSTGSSSAQLKAIPSPSLGWPCQLLSLWLLCTSGWAFLYFQPHSCAPVHTVGQSCSVE